MIVNVNSPSFEEFGAVFAEKGQPAALINGHSVALSPGETAVYETVAETWLGCGNGIPVLSVSTQSGQNLDFYLDRTLRLKPGVQFSLTALGQRAVVQMAGFSLPRLVQTRAADRFEIHQKLKITRLCALLYQEKEPGFLFPGAADPVLEMVYVDSGSLHAVADGQEILLEQGDMILYGKEQWHTQHADRDVAPKLVTVTFDAEGVELESLCNRRLRLPQRAIGILQEMLREQERMDEFSEDMLITLLQGLLLSLLRDAETREKHNREVQCLSSENQVIRQAQQYIAGHIMEKMTVPLVAQGIGVSASHLTALFHKNLQISPGEYIRRMKLQESKRLIREGNMNFTEISKSLEYSTVHHFSRQFKAMFGMTPSEYQKRVR